MRRLPRLAALAFVLATGCSERPPAGGGPHRLPLELVEVGAFGDFLESLPATAARRRAPTRLIRPLASRGFEADYRRSRLATGDAGEPGRFVIVNLLAARPGGEAAFAFRCPAGSAVRARWWALAPGSEPAQAALALRAGDWRAEAPLPEPGRVGLFEAALPVDFCRGDAVSELHLATEAGGDVLVSPPALMVPAASPPPPLILISVDTLRADYWQARDDQPAGLRAFFEDAIRYTRAYSSFPSTALAHSVMFSGAFPREIGELPDAGVSFASALRDAGYATLGFASGGFVRAIFGFGKRYPGFATGFDVYVEGLHAANERAGQGARPPPPSHYTLAASLERSLLAWMASPDDSAFHFVHGFDVHAYRMAPRGYWDQAVAERVGAGTPSARIADCAERVGIEIGSELVVHNPGESGGDFRRRPLGELADCQRLLTAIFYRARVRSAEDLLARYFDALRELGVYDPAVIVLTSDHGESLLDEPVRGGRPWWGHSRVLHNTLHVPLLVKPPGTSGEGRDVDELVGLVDLRATLGELLGIDTGASRGVPIAARGIERPHPILFSGGGEAGGLLADGRLCSWRDGRRDLRVFRDGRWASPSDGDARACEAVRGVPPPEPMTRDHPDVPPELREELRALGYAE